MQQREFDVVVDGHVLDRLCRFEELSGVRRGALEQLRAAASAARPDQVLEELADDPVRERTLDLGAACAQDREAGVGRASSPLREQRRLPDSCRTLDHGEPAPAGT